MCHVRSIYLSPPRQALICTEIVVTVLLLFFSSSPSCFLLNANFLQGSCTCRFSENTPYDLMCFCLRCALHHTDVSPYPFRWTESHCDCEKCVLCWDETCSPESSRDNNSQRGGQPRWSRRYGHASLPESFLNLLEFDLPLSCSRGHLVSAKILSSKNKKLIVIKQKKKPYIKLGLGTDFSYKERKRPQPSGASRVFTGI